MSNPPQLPPLFPVNYQSPGTPPPQGRSVGKQLMIGIAIGTLASLIVWPIAWKGEGTSSGSSTFLSGVDPVMLGLIIVPSLKLIGGITFLCLRGRRGYGGGVLISLALGFLIFFGACAAI